MTVPEAVRVAAAAHRRMFPPITHPLAEIAEGEIVTVATVDDPADMLIAVIVRVRDSHLMVVPCHNVTEMATDIDMVIPGAHNRPYALVAQTDLCTQVWRSQVRLSLGMLLADELEGLRNLPVEPSEYSGGLPLQGRVDPRWAFKESEFERVMPFTLPCRTELLTDAGFFDEDDE